MFDKLCVFGQKSESTTTTKVKSNIETFAGFELGTFCTQSKCVTSAPPS